MAQRTQAVRALVLGANGKLGKMLCAAWAQESRPALDILPVARGSLAGLKWCPGDRPGALPDADVVIGLWGVTPAHGGDLADNTRLAHCAMEVARAVGADRVVHCSTAAVYATDGAVAREDDALAPVSDYGKAKADMERALGAWQAKQPGGPVPVILRIGNVVGAESLFAAIRGGGAVTLDRFADGQGPRRSYIAPGDLARVIAGICHASLDDLAPVYNVSAPGVTAMADLARAAGAKVQWRPAPAAAVPVVALDTARLQALCPLPKCSADADRQVADWRRWTGPQ